MVTNRCRNLSEKKDMNEGDREHGKIKDKC